MNHITTIGIDLAKNVFQIHAQDSQGNKVFNKQFKRAKFKEQLVKLPPCLIGMEACGTSHYWARECLSLGHQVKLMNPKRVKAFLSGNKNDAKDAEAICDAGNSNKVRGIAVKTIAQQDLTALHRARSQVISRRTQVGNHLRSQLAEYGIVTRKGHAALSKLLQAVLSGEHLQMSNTLSFVLTDLYQELQGLNERIKQYDQMIMRITQEHKTAKRLLQMPGIGPISATAIVAKVEDVDDFKSGRQFAAWLGLTPREDASAERRHLGKISKRGDRYIRTLLIHGARSVVHALARREKDNTAYHRWIRAAVERCGMNKAVVALANKHARMIWAILHHDRQVDLNFVPLLNVAA